MRKSALEEGERWLSQADENHFVPASIFIVEPLGVSTVVTVDVADARMQIVTPSDFTAKANENLWLAFDPACILLFDKSSTKTIPNRMGLNESGTTSLPTT